VVVAFGFAVPLVAEDGHKATWVVVLAGEFDHLGPASLGNDEAVDPFVFDSGIVVPDIGPVSVGGEAVKIEMVPRDLEGMFQRALRVAHLVVVVEISEVVLVWGRRLGGRGAACR